MINEDFLKILVCPEDRSPLELADTELVRGLNESIARRELKNRGNQTLETPLDAALIRSDRQVAYPIINDLPMLLVDSGILLDQVVRR